MRKKIAVTVVLATIAFSTGSIHSHLLHAAQHTATQIPASYMIISPGNTTHTYDFSSGAGTDKWAYQPQAQQNPPLTDDDPSTPVENYSRIAADDGVTASHVADSNTYAAHRFVFTLNESAANITGLTVLWNGRGLYLFWFFGWYIISGGVNLYIWNVTASGYDLMQATSSIVEENVTASLTAPSNYISADGNITVLVEQLHTSQGMFFYSYLATDYIKIEVTHREGP